MCVCVCVGAGGRACVRAHSYGQDSAIYIHFNFYYVIVRCVRRDDDDVLLPH